MFILKRLLSNIIFYKLLNFIYFTGGNPHQQHVIGETYNAVIQVPMTFSSSLDAKTVSLIFLFLSSLIPYYIKQFLGVKL